VHDIRLINEYVCVYVLWKCATVILGDRCPWTCLCPETFALRRPGKDDNTIVIFKGIID